MASLVPNATRKKIMNAGIVLLTDTLKVMLVSAAYTPNKDHEFVSSLSANELSGTGYTSGFGSASRKTLASKTILQDDTADIAFFDAADVSWTAINAGTVGCAVVIKEGTSDADSSIVAVIDISPDVATNGGDYTIQWAATGIFKWTSV